MRIFYASLRQQEVIVLWSNCQPCWSLYLPKAGYKLPAGQALSLDEVLSFRKG